MRSAFNANLPLHAHFLRLVQKHPDKECLIELATGRRMTFAQFNAHTNKYANLFQVFQIFKFM
jgi:acyl-CoA synthetase (AMP-forming)/AMP-acid ligase II